MSNEQCDIMYVHEDKVKNASDFLSETHTIKAMNTLNAIGDKKKLTILFALLEEEKLCLRHFEIASNEYCLYFSSSTHTL